MRTTVTLDPDVAAMLREMMREKNLSFKEAINTAIRRGTLSQQPSQKRFKQKTYAMGIRDGIDMTKALNIAANLEDEEILRKMARPAGGAIP